jgi:hypothetical protein
MQVNSAFRAPAIARRHSSTERLTQKKIFGAQTGPGAPSRRDPEQERLAAQVLQASEAAMRKVDENIIKAFRLVKTFNDFVTSVRKMESRRRAKKKRERAKLDASGNDTLWRAALKDGPGQQQDHGELCRLLLAQYRAKLDEMFLQGHMRKVWEDPGSNAHLFSKAERDTVSYRRNMEGRGEAPLGQGFFTDIAAKLRRQIHKWSRVPNLPPFDNSGVRFRDTTSGLPDVDTAGVQLAIMSKWWGSGGVKFNDVDRDTMAFAKATAPQGAQRYYEKKSTLDEIHEYRFPFKCSDERFPPETDEERMLLGASGVAMAAARRKKGMTSMRRSRNTSGAADALLEGGSGDRTGRGVGEGALDGATLGVHMNDPIDDEDLGLPTDYLRRLEPYERFGTMKSNALRARLSGPSPSFRSKVDRSKAPLSMRKEVYPDQPVGSEFALERMRSSWSAGSRQLFSRGPSGREVPWKPNLRMAASSAARFPMPETLEEYETLKKGFPLTRRRGGKGKVEGSIGRRGGGGGSRGSSKGAKNKGAGDGLSAGGSMLQEGQSMLIEGGSALMPGQKPGGKGDRGSSMRAPSMPSRVPGDSTLSKGGVAQQSSGYFGGGDSLMDGMDSMESNGAEEAMYDEMEADADVDAIMSFSEGSGSTLMASKSKMRSTSTVSLGSSMGQQSTKSTLKSSSRKLRPVGMQVTIRSPAGAYVTLRVTPQTTIAELRSLATAKTGLSQRIRKQLAQAAVMVFRKRVIPPECTLAQAKVANGSTLQALQYW